MKKILSILLIITQVTFINAQSLTVTGATIAPTTDPCLQTHTAPITVKNVSSDTLHVLCEKIIIDTSSGTSNFFCWGANCYGSLTYISSSFNELLPGEGDNLDFGGYYDAYCDLASATIEYCFFPDTDPTDRTCLTIIYNGATSEIHQSNTELAMGEFYPNPANDYITINYSSAKNAYLNIYDVLGHKVKAIHLSNTGSQRIYIGDLNKGMYFGNFLVNSEVVMVKKLIIK